MAENKHLEKVLPENNISVASVYGDKPVANRSIASLVKGLVGVAIVGVGLTTGISMVHAEHHETPKLTMEQINSQVSYAKEEMQSRINEFAKSGSLKGSCAEEQTSGLVGSVRYKGNDAYLPMAATTGVTPSDAEHIKFNEPTHSDCKPANYYDGESERKTFPLPDTNNPNDPRIKQIIDKVGYLYKADLIKTNGVEHDALQDPTPRG